MTAPSAPPQVAVAGQSQLPRGDITRVLGADAPPPVDPAAGESLAASADARFQLVGVVAPRGSETARGGVALIAVDGKPPRAYRVGALVDGENIVQAIRARGADLGPLGGKVVVALNIPPPAPPATGTLPDARTPGAAAPAAPPPVPTRALPVAPPPAAVPTPTGTPRRGMPATAPPPAATPAPSMPVAPPPGQVVPLPAVPGSAQPQIR